MRHVLKHLHQQPVVTLCQKIIHLSPIQSGQAGFVAVRRGSSLACHSQLRVAMADCRAPGWQDGEVITCTFNTKSPQKIGSTGKTNRDFMGISM